MHLSLRPSIILIVLSLVLGVWAKPAFVPIIKQASGAKSDSALMQGNCNICHNAATAGSKWNSFGMDLRAAIQKSSDNKLTPETIASVAKKDSDNDTCYNGDELKAGTLPGDAASMPAKTLAVSLKIARTAYQALTSRIAVEKDEATLAALKEAQKFLADNAVLAEGDRAPKSIDISRLMLRTNYAALTAQLADLTDDAERKAFTDALKYLDEQGAFATKAAPSPVTPPMKAD